MNIMTKTISASILSADFIKLGKEIQDVIACGINSIHFDAMDNHYVPNLTMGPMICSSIRKHFPSLIIDVHIMAVPVDQLIQDFAKAGADSIIIHHDAATHLDRSLELIKELGCKSGIALNPATSFENIKYIIDKLDTLLLMTVNPGFGGQVFIKPMLDKIQAAKILLTNLHKPNIDISVDGGITEKNIQEVAKCGVNNFIVGSTIFQSYDYQQVITSLKKLIA